MCISRKQASRFFFLQTMVTVAALSLADVVLEKAMHKCILKPLKGHVEAMLKHFHVADGSWKQLKENLQLVRQRNPQELGVFAPTPDFVDVEKIKVKFMTMQKMYSPEKKVMLLLRVCKLIYTVMENNSGEATMPSRLLALRWGWDVLGFPVPNCSSFQLLDLPRGPQKCRCYFGSGKLVHMQQTNSAKNPGQGNKSFVQCQFIKALVQKLPWQSNG